MKKDIEFVEVFEVVTEENYNEQRYLQENADVRDAVNSGKIKSGYQHFKNHGKTEHRKQQKEDYQDAITALRKEKAKRVEKILRPDIQVVADNNFVFDYTGEERKEKFGFDETEKVSSFFYDQMPLDIINSMPEGLILDCGAGFRPVYYENVVNYEIVPYPTTDVIGFAEDLPFADNSFDAVFSFAVLEHVKLPFQAAREMCRVLKPNGIMAVCAAFLQPRHGYPHHYFNMTDLGLKVLFEEEINVEKQYVNKGTAPISSLTWFLRRWADNLNAKDRKKFMKLKVADLMGQTDEYDDSFFVTGLSEEGNMELASATLLIGRKK